MIKVGTSGAVLLRQGTLPAYDRGGGARTTPLVGPGAGARSFLNGTTTFDARAALPFHSHNCEESVMLLQGRAALDIEGEEHVLEVFDTTWIPRGVSHRFRNLSATEEMKILWIYGSIDADRTITETGETHKVALEHGN